MHVDGIEHTTASMIAALDDYRAGRMRRAAARLEASLRERPRDSLAFKLSHNIRFLLGDAAGMRGGAELAARGIVSPLVRAASHPNPDVRRSSLNALVAAGSVITQDVPDDALAIARGRQAVKPGRGFKGKGKR